MELLTLRGFNREQYMNEIYSKGLGAWVDVFGEQVWVDDSKPLPAVLQNLISEMSEASVILGMTGDFTDKVIESIILKYFPATLSREELQRIFDEIINPNYNLLNEKTPQNMLPLSETLKWHILNRILALWMPDINALIQSDKEINNLWNTKQGAAFRNLVGQRLNFPNIFWFSWLGEPPRPESKSFFDKFGDFVLDAVEWVGDKASAVLSLSWEDLIPGFVKDAINEVKSLPDLIPSVMQIVNNAGQWLNPVAMIKQIQPVLFEYLRSKFNSIVKEDILNQVVEAINQSILNEINDKIAPVQNLIEDFNHINELPALIQDKVTIQLNQSFEKMSNNFNSIQAQAEGIFSAAGNLSLRIENLIKAQKSMAENIQLAGLSGSIADAVNMVRDLSDKISPTAVMNFFMNSVVTPIIDQFRPYFRNIMGELVSYVRPMLDQVTEIIRQITGPLDFLKAVPRISDFVSNIIDNFLFPKVNAAIDQIFESVLKSIQPMFAQLNQFFAQIDAQITAFETGQNELINSMSAKISHYKALSEGMLQNVVDMTEEAAKVYEQKLLEIENSALSFAEKEQQKAILNAQAQAEILKIKTYSAVVTQPAQAVNNTKTVSAEEQFYSEISQAYFDELNKKLELI